MFESRTIQKSGNNGFNMKNSVCVRKNIKLAFLALAPPPFFCEAKQFNNNIYGFASLGFIFTQTINRPRIWV